MRGWLKAKISEFLTRTQINSIERSQLLSEIRSEIRSIRAQMELNNSISRLLASDILFDRPRDPKHIARFSTHTHSQNYEDAIIAEIYRRIGEQSRFFVEIGIETGAECNSRMLLERGWTGVWIDANTDAIAIARNHLASFVNEGKLKIIEAFVDRDNVQQTVTDQIGNAPIDFLSIDVDYNTSHIWRAIKMKARVSCIEYNASYPPSIEWEAPYKRRKLWDGSNYYGASLKTLELIGRSKNAALVGCDFHGVNAFFVSETECHDKFLMPYTAEQHFEPPRYHLITHRGHPPKL